MRNIDKNSNLPVCMQCDKPMKSGFWILDYDGIVFKKVCSLKCSDKAYKELSHAIEEYNNLD